MMLSPPTPRRERILCYGPSNAGKTSNLIDIARWIKQTSAQSQSHIYFIDNDNAWDANNPGDIDDIVTVFPIDSWDDYKPATRRALSSATPNDWVCIDMVGKIWAEVQDAYVDKVYGADLDEFYLSHIVKKDGEVVGTDVGGAFGINWQIINKMYTEIFAPFQRAKCHVYCGAASTEVKRPNPRNSSAPSDNADIVNLFGRIGEKPVGQKDLPYAFHTVLHQQEHLQTGGRVINTAKDRNRQPLKAQLLTEESGFTVNYLMKIGGWRP